MSKSLRDSSNRIKIISLGNISVGKSCLIKRYCEKRFVSKYMATIGIDYGVTRLKIRDYDIRMNIFDFSGHPLFYEVRNEFYNDTQGVMLVFDVNNRKTFDSLDYWLNEMKKDIRPIQLFDQLCIVVVANKIDTNKRVVDESEARLWANVRGYQYFETSAQTGVGVQEMFDCLFSSIIDVIENGELKVPNIGFTIEQVEAINRLKNTKDNYERLGLKHNCTKDEINNAYRKLAKLLHPDKSVAPGSEEAFKLLLNAKTDLLNKFDK
ncbi:unnamed protein product [Didymodactylos carnosus]|uniref:J domain-containing protein n=1 Tax=Didymodactylos carnosus TaxID=1234261 RepID=A0A813SGE3_9BILA|nr:unnamed protein product [Didymodactylos carnosus]CAF0921238.1 unnamed protein product [Didymodactylos carnosus]CAF3580510.1 unnamed protein product [Didymodactylos carnosus]CAF3698692.1 unnamed protein product [Didymodactylos carnosus]